VSTAGYVKLLLPPRQSRGNSHWGLATVFGYDPTERVAYIGPMLIEEDASYETFEETAVASSSGSNRLGTDAGHN
jgi:hypothetical protein